MKALVFYTLILMLISCSRPSEFEKYLSQNADTSSNLKLYYTQFNDTSLNSIRIIGKIINNREQAVNIMTYTCQGEEFLFECDTMNYFVDPRMWCQLIYPRKKTILPKDTLTVRSTLFPKDSSFRDVRNIAFKFIEIKKDLTIDKNTSRKEIDSLRDIGVINEILLKGERFDNTSNTGLAIKP